MKDYNYTGMKIKKGKKLQEFNSVKELTKIGYQEMRKKNTCMYGINMKSKNQIQRVDSTQNSLGPKFPYESQ